MNNNEVELRVDARALVGEGPIWDIERQVLYWVDILSHKLYIYDPVKDENQAFDIGQAVGTVVPRVSGGLMRRSRGKPGMAIFSPLGPSHCSTLMPSAKRVNIRASAPR